MVTFEVIPPIDGTETFASGTGIRERKRLMRVYGGKHWKKCKGFAKVKINDTTVETEIHWYEAHGIGKVEMKIKQIIGELS